MNTFQINNVTPFEMPTRGFEIQWEKIESVYKGRLNVCACGCAGDYLYTKHYAQSTAGNEALIGISSDKMDNRIKTILGEMCSHTDAKYQIDNGGVIIEVETHRENETIWEDEDVYDTEEHIFGYRLYLKFKAYE